MIAQGLSIGIGKRELLEDYYIDELEAIFGEHNVIHRLSTKEASMEGMGGLAERVDAEEFLKGW